MSLGHLFHTVIINKGGQVTKPIIVVKICYKLLYVIQVNKRFLISNFLASTDIKVFGRTYLFAASDWPHTFFTSRVFLFSIYRNTYQDRTLSQHEVNSPDTLQQPWHFSHVPSFECVGSLNHD